MRKKHLYIFMALSLIGGFAGGYVATRVLAPEKAVAQSEILEEIKTKRVLIFDNDGNKLAMFGTNAKEQAAAGMQLFDGKGNSLMTIVSTKEGHSTLLMTDKNGNSRIALKTEGNSEAGLYVGDRNGKLRVMANVFPDNSSSFSLFDEEENRRFGAAATNKGNNGVSVFDRNGVPRVSIGVLPNQNGDINIMDSEHHTIWYAPEQSRR